MAKLKEEIRELLREDARSRPECPVRALLLSQALLESGEIVEGLRQNEKRFNPVDRDDLSCQTYIRQANVLDTLSSILRNYTRPRWDGTTSLQNKTILVFNEGGYGDAIQNVRFLRRLKQMGATTLFEVERELESLLKGMDGVDELIAYPNKVLKLCSSKEKLCRRVDYIVSSQSLPYLLSPGLEGIEPSPYVVGRPSPVVMESDKLNIGIVWGGNPGNLRDTRRSAKASSFRHLASVPNARLYSLQKGRKESLGFDCVDLEPLIKDFGDTASIMASLDAIVSVDTSAAHLAGALGKPVWIVMPYTWADWRWQKRWYARQVVARGDDWDELMLQVATLLSDAESSRRRDG